MNEAYLKRRLKARVLSDVPGSVVYRHEDKFTGGVPDMSVTRRGAVCWVEVKFHRNGKASKPTEKQESALRKLRGLLVTYKVVRGVKTTEVRDYEPYGALVPGQTGVVPGFDHEHVAGWVRAKLERAGNTSMRDTPEVDLVREFHEKFDLPRPDRPVLDARAVRFRLDHIKSEVAELEAALEAGDLAGVADALVDITYLAEGTAVNTGVPWRQLFLEVHRANMEKTRTGGIEHKQGIFKPAGWRGPDVEGILRRAGWVPPERKVA